MATAGDVFTVARIGSGTAARGRVRRLLYGRVLITWQAPG
ncbi:hypothetical protein I551_5423 [Mycobacterium ulcerans str. Harvey]|uniref:Uncharacterized protein n=1 Tax=Mycobacterium ulcerans str. Harvey TaxID=1299332 RepID=A0ABP3ABT6_MYCUL|nr:hypothetical protein I551_5423 [Mycobacterium ulcerans str. Harvey]